MDILSIIFRLLGDKGLIHWLCKPKHFILSQGYSMRLGIHDPDLFPGGWTDCCHTTDTVPIVASKGKTWTENICNLITHDNKGDDMILNTVLENCTKNVCSH